MPELPVCPREKCKAPINHWHSKYGEINACWYTLNGYECDHDPADEERCYAPRVPKPAAQPTEEALMFDPLDHRHHIDDDELHTDCHQCRDELHRLITSGEKGYGTALAFLSKQPSDAVTRIAGVKDYLLNHEFNADSLDDLWVILGGK